MNTITFRDLEKFAQFLAALVREGIQFETAVDEVGGTYTVRCTGGF